MRKLFLIGASLTFLWANSIPLINYDPFYKSQKILHVHFYRKREGKPFVLSAIYNKRAFINNRFYSVGEKIKGYRIKKIYKQSVILQNHSNIRILHLQNLQKKHFILMKQAKREEK